MRLWRIGSDAVGVTDDGARFFEVIAAFASLEIRLVLIISQRLRANIPDGLW